MEVSDWLAQLSAGDQELKSIQERLQAAQRSAEELNTQTHQKSTELAEHRLALTQTEEELLQANSVLSSIDADLRIGEERLANSRQREQELTRQIQNLQESIQRETARAAELAQQLTTQTNAIAALETEGARIEADYAEAQKSFNGALQQLEAKKQHVKEARDLILNRAQERARLQQQIGQVTSDVTRFESRAEAITREKDRVSAQADEVIRQVHAAENAKADLERQMGEKSSRLETATRRIAEVRAKEQDLRRELLLASEEIAKLKGQIHSIRDQQSQDPYLAGAQAVLSAGLPGINGPISRLIRASAEDRDIVAAAIGENLADLVADTADDAQRAVDFLRENEKGRARIWILDRVPPAPDSEGLTQVPGGIRLLTRIQSEEKYRALLAHLCGSSWIQDSAVYGAALVNGGVSPSKWKTHVTHRLPELERSLEEMEGAKGTLEQKSGALDAEIRTLSNDRESAIKEMEEVRIRLEIQNTDRERLLKRRQALQEEQQVIDLEAAQIQEDKVKAQYQLEEATGRFQALQNREKEDHDQLDLLQQELTDLQHMHAKANAELSAKTERHRDFVDKLNWQKSIADHSRRELSGVSSAEARHRESLTQVTSDIDLARAAQTEATQLIESSVAKRNEAADACTRIQTRRLELAQKIQAAEQELAKIRSQFSAAQESTQTELIQDTALKGRTETIIQKLRDQYELTLDAAREQFTPQPADPETLERLKKRVANMGPINLAAPQEHAELMEKNTFLTTQQQDLLKAKEDLRQVITKINATTREHFRETFQTVRENFRSLYGKLFQGGEADLRFTDEADILNTGIDIFCQPPGKKLLHISLLSGGEKALTAIALLFAFFQVRPSPITLLDEVDAPLDEANVLRYAEMLRAFSEKSQFLLITHNKRTMETANSLYGVTMEELGVSKVLSARLTTKEAKKVADVAEAPAATPANR